MAFKASLWSPALVGLVLRAVLFIQLLKRVGSGIGRECALSFAVEGAKGVIFADLDMAKAEEAAAESRKVAIHPGFEALTVKVDVKEAESVQDMVAQALNVFGRIDYAVNSAGVSHHPTSILSKVKDLHFKRLSL